MQIFLNAFIGSGVFKRHRVTKREEFFERRRESFLMADYKETIFLPKTDFPMKANLAEREPLLVAKWRDEKLYETLRRRRKGASKYILHYGPPYANGNIHIGHAFTEAFKDIVCRAHSLSGKDAPLVPGWDCHGLPIEWKIEEEVRAAGKRKEEIDSYEFRARCRSFADKWIPIQKEEFRRLGILADWENPYITMDFKAEASIAQVFMDFVSKGYVYRGVKPVMWSVVEQTALADAEIEYQDHTSPSIYVRFPIYKTSSPALAGASVLIWTTTPWSLPGNRAVAFGEDIDYTLLTVTETSEGSLAEKGEQLLVASELMENVTQTAGITDFTRVATLKGTELTGSICRHPFHSQGYDFEVPLLPGEHVTTEAGTGLVHTAPGHGEEDFSIGKKYHLEIPETIADDGVFYEHVPLFKGLHVFKADPVILEKLKECGALLQAGKIVHSYPHSWRSKKPLIYRATAQWFISMESNSLREKALSEIEKVRWFPSQAKNRIRGMLEGRPDWCISRQRAWGVPLTLFVDKKTLKPLIDPHVNQRIIEAFELEGADAWFTSPPERFLGSTYRAEDYEQITDILDVWFDSGSTQRFVLQERTDLTFPADTYLEGSDQHRGWFQSSLLIGCGINDQAPYKNVVTHGFTLDEQGRKMSKSLGNIVAPSEICTTLGADILRLWIVSCDYTDDLRIGPEILKHQQDIYRRYRNTFRYLLGALAGFSENEACEYKDMPDLEKWVLHKLSSLQELFEKALNEFTYQEFYSQLHLFCSVDLSAYYFDIRKDVLYCDHPDDLKRRATRTVFNLLHTYLCQWLAPVLCFTAEEAWTAAGKSESVHLSTVVPIPQAWKNEALSEKYERVRALRKSLTGALEVARNEGLIGSSLQARLEIYDPEELLVKDIDYAELAIVSNIEISNREVPDEAFRSSDLPALGVVVSKADGAKCDRCWKILPEVGSLAKHPDLCRRCHDVVERGVA